MKLSPFRTVLVASVALLISASPTARAADTDDLLFYAPFDGTPEALDANGDPAATVVTEGAFAFKDGIRGQAVVFGESLRESNFAVWPAV